MESFLKFYLSVAENDAPLSGFITITSYILEKCGWDVYSCLRGDTKDVALASRVLSYGIVSIIRKFYNRSVIVAGDSYFVVSTQRSGGSSLRTLSCVEEISSATSTRAPS